MSRPATQELLDTSVLIGTHVAGVIELPVSAAISVVTLGELRAGVQLAPSGPTKQARRRRLEAIRVAFEPLPVDEAVAEPTAICWPSPARLDAPPRRPIS